jgi:hypothetical protein
MLFTKFFPLQPLLGNMSRMRAPQENQGNMKKNIPK